MAKRFLLLQVRRDQETRREEWEEFVRFSGLEASCWTARDVFHQPDFGPECLDGQDALFIGGSSDATVLDPVSYPFVPSMMALLRFCLAQNFPVFASCFGFQVAVVALGGTVIRDPENLEMGTFPITLTPAAHADPLFWDTPPQFWAVSGHQERCSVLPDGCIALAATPRCPYHAFTVPGKPFYAFQFHPEVDRPDLKSRLERYGARYLSDGSLPGILENLQETPVANGLIQKFIGRIL